MLIIYSKPSCAQCDQTKRMAAAYNIDYTEVMLDVGQPKLEGTAYITREDLLKKIPSARMMPQIMTEAGELIGSWLEFRAWVNKYLESRNAS